MVDLIYIASVTAESNLIRINLTFESIRPKKKKYKRSTDTVTAHINKTDASI